MPDYRWARLLTYVTGLVNQKLLLQNEYLAAENRILRAHLPARMRLSDPERSTLAEIGKRLGRSALQQVACVAKPDTILAWYRRLIARKFDGSKFRTAPGRPRIEPELEALIVRFARENSGWGYDRIAGALANLGHSVSDQTVGNILRRYGIQPAPKRSQNTTWKDFIASHMAVLAGTDFFTVEVLTWRGLATYYVLFFIHLESRRVSLAGLTNIPPPSGCFKWLATPPTRVPAFCADNGTFFMIGIRSSALRFWMSCDRAGYGHWPFRQESESERFRRALGVFDSSRMPVQTDFVW